MKRMIYYTSTEKNAAVQAIESGAMFSNTYNIVIFAKKREAMAYAGEDLPECESQSQPAQPVEKAAPQASAQAQATAQKPAQGRDTRPATKEMLGFVRKAIAERSFTADFICKSYKVAKLDDLCVYQAIHIKDNLSRLERMYLATL